MVFRPGNRLRALLVKNQLSLKDVPDWNPDRLGCSSVESLHDAAAFCRAWLEVMLDHQADWIRFPLPLLLNSFLEARFWPNSEFLSRAKYATAWPLARYMRNDLPPCAYPELEANLGFYARGPLLKVLRNRLNAYNPRNDSLWWSHLQGTKRGAAPARDSHIRDNLVSQAKTMGTPPNPDICQERFKFRLERAMDVILPRAAVLQPLNKYLLPIIEPTTGASYEHKFDETTRAGIYSRLTGTGSMTMHRSQAIDHWYELIKQREDAIKKGRGAIYEPGGSQEYAVTNHVFSYLMQKHFSNACLDKMVEVRPGVVVELRNHFPDWDLRSALTYQPDYLYPHLKVNRTIERELDAEDMMEYYDPAGPIIKGDHYIYCHERVQMIALLEPLKIRTISKGNSLHYWSSRCVQRLMHKSIKKLIPLSLVGESLQVDHLMELVKRTTAMATKFGIPVSEFDHFVSGDFKGATDYLDINRTKLVFEAFLARMCPGEGLPTYDVNPQWKWLVDRWRSVIFEQELHYKHGAWEEIVQQANGQLMGSNLSFPILCIVNLISYWEALEEHFDTLISIEDLPVLVNGDDILFMSPGPESGFYAKWKSSITEAGFRLSVGKNYIHNQLLTVNSEMWRWNKLHSAPSFTRVRHLDVGLLMNDNSAQRLENRTLPLAERLQRVLEGANNKARIWNRLKHYYCEDLKKWTQEGKYNVFATLQQGGLGVEKPDIVPNQFTKYQRRFAGWMRKTQDKMSTEQEAGLELLRLRTEKDPCVIPSSAVRWHNRSVKWYEKGEAEVIVEDDPSRLICDDEVKGTWFVPDKRVLSSEAKKFTCKTRKGFERAFRNGIVPLGNPAALDRVLLYEPVRVANDNCSKSLSEPRPKRIFGVEYSCPQCGAMEGEPSVVCPKMLKPDGQQTARNFLKYRNFRSNGDEQSVLVCAQCTMIENACHHVS